MDRLLKDPTGFLVSVVAWSVSTAATLLAPGAVFSANPIYRAIRKLPLPEVAWGGLMLLVAALLLAGLLRPSATLRLVACLYATGLWVFYGALLVRGGLGIGDGHSCGMPTPQCPMWPDEPDGRVLFSAGGAYGLFVGMCCALAAAQWAYYTPGETLVSPEQASTNISPVDHALKAE